MGTNKKDYTAMHPTLKKRRKVILKGDKFVFADLTKISIKDSSVRRATEEKLDED